MTQVLQPALAEAQTAFQSLLDNFGSAPGSGRTAMIVLAGIGLAILSTLGVYYYLRKRAGRGLNDSAKLLFEISLAHSLTWSQKRLLRKLAKIRKVKDPCEVTLAVEHWVIDEDVTKSLRPKAIRQLVTLQQVLFTQEREAKDWPVSSSA